MQKVTMEDLGNIYMLSDVSYSPNGKAAAFVVNQALVKENKYSSCIWILENNTPRKLTTGGSESSYLWLDSENLIFPGDRKKNHPPLPGQSCTVYNKINIHGGEAEEYFSIPMKVKTIRKVSDHEFLFTGVYQHHAIDLSNLKGEDRDLAIAQIEEEKDYEVFDELPFWANGRGVINKQRTRLYFFDRISGAITLLSPEYMNVNSFDYSKKLDAVVYHGHDYQWMDDQKDDMYVCWLHGGNTVEIALEHRYGVSAAAFLGEQIILSASNRETYGSSENPVFFLADPKTGEVHPLADLDPSMFSSVGSDCRYGGGRSHKGTENNWYHTQTIGFNSYIMSLDKNGNNTVVSPEIDGSIDCFDYFEGNFLYIGMRENGLQELYLSKEGSNEEQKLTSFNDEYLNSHAVSPLHPLKFVDQDGVEIDGWVIEPINYDPNQTYPAILDVHGGPKTVYGVPFFHEMQLWASEGYFVFFCNPRGGDGKGNEFADIRGKRYGVLDYNDLMEFTDQVLARYPQIDKTRVGMTGGSYGGFMANWIVGHTDRFAAVASQRSISNFISKCLTTDIGYYHNLSAVQADPWNNPEEMWERSPLKYADKCKTPTLFIQSDEDYRCWMGDAIQMFTALRMHGVPTRLCLFHGENHELSRSGKPKHRIRRLREITNWFNQYLK